jgi:NAD(P)-dependent dehydrogenase (short-subunit alcohol dehydrogenase family)
MGLLDGKVAIVTGAGRGIGRGEALELAREGARVVVNEVDAEAGQAVVDEIAGAGGEAVAHVGDCSEESHAASLVATALDRWGQIDALVNNAGILRDRTVVNMSAAEWDAVVKVHLRGHFLPTHLACAHWKETGTRGRIVCTSSTSGILGNFGQANYGAAKAGIAAFSTIVAMEMARYGVTCNAIAPSARTRMTVGAFGEMAVAEGEFDFWDPDNVAPFVTFLCSDAAGDISGKVFGVQGDTVEIYQPFTSVGVIDNGGTRWSPSDFTSRVGELWDGTGVRPEIENMMARMRYRLDRP